MNKILVVIDMQNDFIDGALGTKEAEAIVKNVIAKIKSYKSCTVYATRDTHQKNYLKTQEGKYLSVKHCIEGTEGWQIHKDVAAALKKVNAKIIDKPSFGSRELAELLAAENKIEPCQVELVGLCTDICVVSNAIMIKGLSPEMPITVDASCCAGVTPEKHNAAIETMRSCQIEII